MSSTPMPDAEAAAATVETEEEEREEVGEDAAAARKASVASLYPTKIKQVTPL